MFGITAGMIGTAASVASAGAGIAGAAGAGGSNGPSKEDKMWNDYLRLKQMGLIDKGGKVVRDASRVYKDPSNWQPYGGDRVAGFNPDQLAAMDMVRGAAGGNRYMDAAGNATMDALSGKYLDHTAGTNSYLGSTVGSNPLLGVNNPYLNSQINQAQGDVSRQFNMTTAPQTDANFARQGAFGGSAWGQQTAENNRQLANELGRIDSNMRMADYTNQQNLYESGLNRSQRDLDRNASLSEDAITRNESSWQRERDRMMSGIDKGLSMNDQLFKNAGFLGAVGDKEYDQKQKEYDAAMAAYREKQDAARAPVDWMQGVLGKQGGLIMQPTSASPTTSSTNPYAMGMGIGNTVAGLAGNKDFTGMFGGNSGIGGWFGGATASNGARLGGNTMGATGISLPSSITSNPFFGYQ